MKGFIDFTHRSPSVRCGTRTGTSYTTKILANISDVSLVEEYACRGFDGMEAVKSKIRVRNGMNPDEFFSDLSVGEVKKLIEEAT